MDGRNPFMGPSLTAQGGRAMLLKGKTALITGSAQGIGAALAVMMAEEGADICLTDIRQEGDAYAVVEKIRGTGQKAVYLEGDVSSFAAASTVVETAAKTLGRLDILVNNAGINWDGVCWKMKEEQWDKVLEINLKGYFNYTRHIAPLFKEQGYGRIVNVTSINGIRGKFGQSNYAASKAGVIGYTKAVAKELGPYGVTVNAVAPGLIETPMLMESGYRDKIIDLAMAEMVLKQLGQPEDLANLICFLASDKARHITGEVIKVDGGQYI